MTDNDTPAMRAYQAAFGDTSGDDAPERLDRAGWDAVNERTRAALHPARPTEDELHDASISGVRDCTDWHEWKTKHDEALEVIRNQVTLHDELEEQLTEAMSYRSAFRLSEKANDDKRKRIAALTRLAFEAVFQLDDEDHRVMKPETVCALGAIYDDAPDEWLDEMENFRGEAWAKLPEAASARALTERDQRDIARIREGLFVEKFGAEYTVLGNDGEEEFAGNRYTGIYDAADDLKTLLAIVSRLTGRPI